MDQPANVSVVIPALNARETIEQAILSILPQPRVAEVIVVDDGSSDGTADVVRSIGDPRIRIVPGPQTGVAGALDCALRAAVHDLVAVCDSDDWWSSDRLEWQHRILAEMPEYIAVSGGFASATPKGDHVADLAVNRSAGDVTDALLDGQTPTSFCTWLTRRSALEEVGFIREWFKTAQEMDLQVRLAEVGRVWHEPKVCYHYRLHDTSVTHTQSADLGAFFTDAVVRFARQRRETGMDDLMRGMPPAVPDVNGVGARPNKARGQIPGHLVGTAWRRFEGGERRAALWQMGRALTMDPLNASIWRASAVMAAKTLLGRR